MGIGLHVGIGTRVGIGARIGIGIRCEWSSRSSPSPSQELCGCLALLVSSRGPLGRRPDQLSGTGSGFTSL